MHTIEDLQQWDEKIIKIVQEIGLDYYPQEFEICDQNEMLGYMAYVGLPSHYPHWSFGKSFERQKTLYKLGVSGLPYELVINSNPCLAYLMKDNTLLLQILTMAHVYGHNDFFKNNTTFAHTRASYVIERFKAHAKRIRGYVEDPSIGIDAVEEILDAAHALKYQCRRNLKIKKLSLEAQKKQIVQAAQQKYKFTDTLKKRQEYEAPDLHKIPLQPEEDVLEFIRNNNHNLEDWQQDLLTIVIEENQYFMPQMETKIMNEGWASYWHYNILQRLNLPQGLHFEFLKRHNQVICPHPGSLNPYHMGFKIFESIFRRWENPTPKDKKDFGLVGGKGLEKLFQVRETDRDQSFLRQYLTKELMQELYLFEHNQNEKFGLKGRYVTKISNEENWRDVRNTLIANVGMNRIPIIKIIDANYKNEHVLFLDHVYDGRQLDLGYAESTLIYTEKLWGRPVILRTTIKGKSYKLYVNGDKANTIEEEKE